MQLDYPHSCLQVRDLQKKMQHVENELDITLEKLTQTATKLDEKLKAYALAEGEIQALKRKISLLEDELERWVWDRPRATLIYSGGAS